MAEPRYADLVLEGGGVKGIALVGAATALSDHGYVFPRIAGSSAGALVGSVLAAMQQAGEPLRNSDAILRTLDYTRMLDRAGVARAFRWWPGAANALGILFRLGMHEGRYMTDWLRGVLADLGVRTFGDLIFDDPGSGLPYERSYRLIATASDLSRQRLIYLPWDLAAYGYDPDEFSVARAARASAAIPFVFEPTRLRSTFGKSTLVDGSLLRAYPIDVFDRDDGAERRWPTIGVRLSAPAGERTPAQPVTGPLSMVISLIYTTVDSTQVRHVSDPLDLDRSIFAETRGVGWVEFDLTTEQQEALYESGYRAAQRWLARQEHNEPTDS